MQPTQSAQPTQAMHRVQRRQARVRTQRRIAALSSVTTLPLTPTLAAVSALPATATLNDVAALPAIATDAAVIVEPATAAKSVVTAEPATAADRRVATLPATALLSTVSTLPATDDAGPGLQRPGDVVPFLAVVGQLTTHGDDTGGRGGRDDRKTDGQRHALRTDLGMTRVVLGVDAAQWRRLRREYQCDVE